MSESQRDFAGKNGYVWFIGVVEGKGDPAKVGRMKVRIIGWHDENTNLLPTEDLPWAQISLPVNGSRNISLPKEGDWVHGFFLDGHAGQQPLIIGVIPGIISKTPKVPTGAADVLTGLKSQLVTETTKLTGMLNGQTESRIIEKQRATVNTLQSEINIIETELNRLTPLGMCDVRTYAQVEAGPKTISGVVTDRKGEPSLPGLSRTIEKTGRQISNANREHVCDFADFVRNSMAAAKTGTNIIAQAIRTALQALIKALAPSPAGSALSEQIKTLKRLITRATEILKAVNEGIATVALYVKKINALIQYLLSLPAKLLAMFKQCLSEAYAELAEGVRLIVADFSGVGDTTGYNFSEITDAAKEAIAATKELATNAALLYSAPGQILGALTNPTTPLTETEAKALIGQLFPDHEEHDIKSFGALF